ncbi:hypothetical protein POPTR_016G026532v4 [Populus trichocarpa]|uniref:Uncharacterized protein n=1 Tax=Populus trichocarpa TaxID=3694 RepID=A0A3N7G1Z6_POPTR|nr:hypothetical protein POPTR_016G026532v4 [Populus trichocarpa]
MSLLLSNPLTSLSSLPPLSSPTLAFIATPEPFNSSLCGKSANCFGFFTVCRWCQPKLCSRMLTKILMLYSLHIL